MNTAIGLFDTNHDAERAMEAHLRAKLSRGYYQSA